MNNPNVLINSDYGPIIINVNDQFISKEIIKNGFYNIEDINFIKKILEIQLKKFNRQITFYDIGSNVGTHSLAVAKSFKNNIKVRAFEAQRIIFNMLCGTMAINGLSNVYCHHLAIGNDSIERLEISLPDYSSFNNFGGLELMPPVRSDNQNMSKNGYEFVNVATIDSLAESVDFIKMDIEGMEDKAIEGAVNTIDKYRPICYIEIVKTNANFVLEFFKTREYDAYRKGMDAIFIPKEYGFSVNGLKRFY